MKTEPVEEFCKNDAAPMVRECPDCVDKYIFLAQRYAGENARLRAEAEANDRRLDKATDEVAHWKAEHLRMHMFKALAEETVKQNEALRATLAGLEDDVERSEDKFPDVPKHFRLVTAFAGKKIKDLNLQEMQRSPQWAPVRLRRRKTETVPVVHENEAEEEACFVKTATIKPCCQKLINTPEIEDFLRAVKIEAAHQREKWAETDPMKSDADFYWLIGWLGGKAVMDPNEPGDERTPRERLLHRIITVAAAAYNWHERAKVR